MVPFLLQVRWHIDSTYPIPIATSQCPTSITTPYMLPQHFCWVVWPRCPPEAPLQAQLCWLGAITWGGEDAPFNPGDTLYHGRQHEVHAGVWKQTKQKQKNNNKTKQKKTKKNLVPDWALLSPSPILSKMWLGGHFAVRIFATPFAFSTEGRLTTRGKSTCFSPAWPHVKSCPVHLYRSTQMTPYPNRRSSRLALTPPNLQLNGQ